jgi:hypothetical protein
MDRTAIEKIVELGEPHIIGEYGFEYCDKELKVVRTPKVETIRLHTLSGLVQALKKEHINFDAPIVVNVDCEEYVRVYSAIDNCDRSREIPYDVTAELIEIPFNRQLDYETMMITLKSKFVETPELLELVKLLGTITEENSATASDDGFSQSVVVRKGIAMKEGKVVKPIVKLKPYRTFSEVDQPESEFLIRLSDGARVAIYEADGGAWKLQARRNVAEYLKTNLAELVKSGEVIVIE